MDNKYRVSWIDHALDWGQMALARMLEHAGQALVLLGADGTIEFSNPAAQQLLGFDQGALLGSSGFDLVHPDDLEQASETLGALMAEPGIRLATRLRLRTAIGEWTTVAVEGVNLDDASELDGVLLSLDDISELAATEEALASSEVRFRDFADQAADFIFRFRVAEPAGFEYASPAAEQLTGHTAEELLADPSIIQRVLPDEEAARVAKHDWTSDRHHSIEFSIVRADGARRWVQMRATSHLGVDGTIETVDGIVRDLTAQRARQDELLHQALHDSLTGLPNRALLYERLEHSLRRNDRVPGSPVVLFLDLDDFKPVNDRFGHAAGDDALVEIGRRLTAAVRPGDTVARLGGDEFLVLCDDVREEADLDGIAERIRTVVAEPIELSSGVVDVSTSIGCSRAGAGDTADEMVRRADLAMYEDKRRPMSERTSHRVPGAEQPTGENPRRRWDDRPA